MDHAIGGGGDAAQRVEVIQGAALHLDPGRGQGRGGGIGAGEPGDLMARAEEFGYDGRADPAGRPGDENVHEKNLQVVDGPGVYSGTSMSVTVITMALDVSCCHHQASTDVIR
jgi:hypothetical protein